ncbi:MAG: hypothetical protein LBC78_02690 [Oscillospiraceae bacterium]|jgi:hypothetical protein|nr:hypothetical protein [Oscillospiraceae bacterium]
MNIELTEKQFRRLIDLVYVGNWILNSTREEHDRIADYDDAESALLSHCAGVGMGAIVRPEGRKFRFSAAFEQGGIHEAISDYEDAVFFEILAEELSRRDMEDESLDPLDMAELKVRIDRYMAEFEANGTNNLILETL